MFVVKSEIVTSTGEVLIDTVAFKPFGKLIDANKKAEYLNRLTKRGKLSDNIASLRFYAAKYKPEAEGEN